MTYDHGEKLRAQVERVGVKRAVDMFGFVHVYIRSLLWMGRGACRWIRMAGERVASQGLPARIFWLGYGDRARFGLKINEMVRRGEITAPIVIGRDHLDAGSVASPNRETEGMRDG